MLPALLIDGGTVRTIVIVCICAVVLIAFAVGVIRKFSRVSWIGLQIPAVFGLLLLIRLIPVGENGILTFALSAGGLFLVTALVLGVSGLIRHAIFRPKPRATTGARVCDRLVGGLFGVVNLVALVAVVGGVVLVAAEYFAPPAAFGAVYETSFWQNFGARYALDLFTVSVFLLFMRAGWRMGLLNALFLILMLALTAGAVVGSAVLVIKVGFIRDLAVTIAGSLSGSLHPAVATVLGYGITALICFAVLFAVVMLFGALVNFLIRKIRSVRALGVLDALILSLVFSVFFIAVVCAFDYGVYYLARFDFSSLGDRAEMLGPTIEAFRGAMQSLEGLLRSSPLNAAFYDHGILRLLLGG